MSTDPRATYERFVYKLCSEPDLCPPHCVWDTELKQFARGVGSFGSRHDAETYAHGMNQAREYYRQHERSVADLIRTLETALRSARACQASALCDAAVAGGAS